MDTQKLPLELCAVLPSACTAAARFTKWSASSMASAGPRGRSRDKPITRIRISVSSRMGTSEQRRRKKLHETTDINHASLDSSMNIAETLHRPYSSSKHKITHSLVYHLFPGLQLQVQPPETICLHCFVPLHFSLLESEFPNITPVQTIQRRPARLTVTALRYRAACLREQESRIETERLKEHSPILRHCNQG